MEVVSCDVLIVGGGGAELRAAIAAAESHSDLRIGVISKVYAMRSHTVSAEGGAAAVIDKCGAPYFSIDWAGRYGASRNPLPFDERRPALI